MSSTRAADANLIVGLKRQDRAYTIAAISKAGVR